MSRPVVLSEDEAADVIQRMTDDLWKDLNTITYGYTKPFYWMRYPNGTVKNMITRGKLMASLAVLRMNSPYVNLKLEGKLPEKKARKNVRSPEA